MELLWKFLCGGETFGGFHFAAIKASFGWEGEEGRELAF